MIRVGECGMSAPASQAGLFFPLTVKAGEVDAGHDFIRARHAHVKASEPDTLQWFALQISGTPRHVIFNTFADQAARQVHMDAALAAGLMDKIGQMAFGEGEEGLSAKPVDILASKVVHPPGAEGVTHGVKCGVRVLLTAKEDRVEAVKRQLKIHHAGILAQQNTPVWVAFWFPGTIQFGIIALFSSEEDREARLAGPAAEAKRANADNLVVPSDIARVDVVAAKF